ncbi:uncharacterized protein V2V93DRAFT_381555 [Kockiozyma suomiensis]|uniref:uncharacterized protein n=1 Tax=Kockiozyma suomiensis TaxID=1337062 RepID=UPI003343295D
MRASALAAMRPSSTATFRAAYANNMRATMVNNMRTTMVLRAAHGKSTAQPTSKLAKVKDVPAELYPLLIAVLVALGAAGYGIMRKFLRDPSVSDFHNCLLV